METMSKRNTLLLLAALCLGVFIGMTLRYPKESSPPSHPKPGQEATRLSSDKTTHQPLASSRSNIEAEQRHATIEKQLAELRTRIEYLEGEIHKNRHAGRNNADIAQASPDAGVSGLAGDAKLIAAGIDASTADWIQQQLDKNQMDELYLQNQARREGWLNKPRYHQARREIQERVDGFREQLGEDTYDRLLYALGRPNRVQIVDVMQDSPAQQNGLNASDMIVSYNGTRVFTTKEIQELASGGDPSAWVLLEISRDGEPLNVYMPGGPLGVRLTTGRVLPQ
jgi:hypothetical protein